MIIIKVAYEMESELLSHSRPDEDRLLLSIIMIVTAV